MKALTRNIRISPKKAQVVADIIRGMDAQKALDLLKYMPNKPAGLFYKTLASAVANAENNDGQKEAKFIVSTVIVTKGLVYKRGNPISRGRSHPILKRTSNLSVELSLR